ncbi:MAG: cob(I)yrinic acid a,c-diamide adenosyltransferase [Actinomycetota bacterium]|nr:cob(I)yrinic acid a,c-diamide adenosyltransferase [Actinomycetota bacterium]MDQ3575391.1 cob(I)yrinic acid a,c-diamide adenosyltransferase [Actinomycetota bacterium]
MTIYTRKGDDGTTGLYFGGRTAKDAPLVDAYGTVDEAQAFLGLARSEAEQGSELDDLLVALERDLWVLMADLATGDDNRHKLAGGQTLVTEEMVAGLEDHIDALTQRSGLPTEFVVPGQNRTGALLDVARTVVRRAERLSVGAAAPGSLAVAYLNRLSDLLWTMARWQEGESLPARQKGS